VGASESLNIILIIILMIPIILLIIVDDDNYDTFISTTTTTNHGNLGNGGLNELQQSLRVARVLERRCHYHQHQVMSQEKANRFP
jgi:hypothetical protein